MDVGDPSNLERILWLYGDDVDRVRREVRAESVSDDQTAETIAAVHERTGYVLDPHSAVAYHMAERAKEGRDSAQPMVVLATAHPAKFPDIVRDAIGRDVSLPPGLARAMELEERMHSIAPTMEAIVGAVASLDGGAS